MESFSPAKAQAALEALDLALETSGGDIKVNLPRQSSIRIAPSIVRASGDLKVRSRKVIRK